MKEPDSVICEPLDTIMRVMEGTYGQDISAYDPSFLRKSVDKRLSATGAKTTADYGEYLAGRPCEADAFSRSLHIIYSEFFRNPLAFALLEEVILPGLVKEKSGRSEIRVWSAGCATGQEAWSVAILLEELAAAHGRPIPYRIFATDIAEAELQSAGRGIYSDAEVRNVRWVHLGRYFTRQGESFVINPNLRERVDFSAYDLLDERTNCPSASIYGDFDVVLCSNVLLYYRPEAQHRILDRLRCCLAPGGYLITGEVERRIVENAGGFRAIVPFASVFKQTKGRR